MTTRNPNQWLIILLLGLFFSLTKGESTIVSNEIVTFTPIQQGDGTLRRIRVPILMYHYISFPPPNADDIRLNLTVTPPQFESHLSYFQTQGYHSLSLYEIDQALDYGFELPDKPIVLTFDDGHSDHYHSVLPLLQAYGFTGTFFIITEFADQNNPQHLTWSQLQEMAQSGMSIQPHTKTHADLTNRDHEFLVYEILGSIESIAAHVGRPTAFAYPIGRYDDTTLKVLSSTSIQRAVTTQFGFTHTTSNRYEMARIRISQDTTTIGLAYLLATE